MRKSDSIVFLAGQIIPCAQDSNRIVSNIVGTCDLVKERAEFLNKLSSGIMGDGETYFHLLSGIWKQLFLLFDEVDEVLKQYVRERDKRRERTEQE